MKSKSALLVLSFLVITILSHAQNNQHEGHESVLLSPADWKSEIIPFPIGFAREIDLAGFEELRFSPGWSDSTSTQFWTYMFVWYVEEGEEMTLDRLTSYMESYYDGLMGVGWENADGEKASDRTICEFYQTETGFAGTFNTFDAFFTKERIDLNMQMTPLYCEKTKRDMFWFEITPSGFESAVWQDFEAVNSSLDCK